MWRLFGKVQAGMNMIGALLIVAIMLLISADVIGRAAFSRPLYGVPELTKFSIICMVWLQMGFTLRQGHHLRSTLILDALPLWPRRAVNVANCLIGAVLMALIAWYSWPDLVRAWTTGTFEGEHPVRVPVWPILTILILGAVVTAVEYAGQALREAMGWPAHPDGAEPVPAHPDPAGAA